MSSGKPPGDGARRDGHDAGGRAGGARRAEGLLLGTVTTQSSTSVSAGLVDQPGPAGRHQGRGGHGGERRRVERLADADRVPVAEPRR